MNAISNIQDHSPQRKNLIRPITRENMDQIHLLLEGGESLEVILDLLDARATNRAILLIANSNRMVGPHRRDFQARTNAIVDGRKRSQ